MTWTETHERTRIIREAEAVAAADMSGAVPWRDEWRAYFEGPAALVASLRARWHRMCEAQLDLREGEEQFDDSYRRLQGAQAGVLAILERAEAARAAGRDVPEVLPLTGMRAAEVRGRARWFQLRGGPVLPV